MYINKEIIINNKKLNIETGRIAKNASASILAEIDGTVLLVSIVHQESEEKDFLPLKVEYFEKYYASGKIPCNYFKREGKPSEREIIISRLVDRSVRPMFPKDLCQEIQITITVISINPEINPDIIAIIATSAALTISGLPFTTIAAIRVGYINEIFYLNPSTNDLKESDLDLVIAGTMDKITIIEANGNEISEDIFLKSIKKGQIEFKNIIENINDFKRNIKIKEFNYKNTNTEVIINYINKNYKDKIKNSVKNKTEKFILINEIYLDIKSIILNENTDTKYKKVIQSIVEEIEKSILREEMLTLLTRSDNRSFTEIRKISLITNFLKNIHGSSVFSRGETQALVSITLGTQKDAQLIDCVFHNNQKYDFILHYNFPPYAVNEIGNPGMIKRREIGHGNLAKKALIPVLPKKDEFPYVIRIVSEITESNGSSSMATVCGGSLALMDAGVPIKRHVAGIAMGIIKENGKYIILSDISGEEDNIGDMDLKVAGTENGITAIQMDVKILGIEVDIIEETIAQAKNGRLYIINMMKQKINKPNENLSEHVPKVTKIKINKTKIKDIIGKGGIIIKSLTEKYDCKIDINNDGIVTISSTNSNNIESIINEIQSLTKEIMIGTIFKGKVIKLAQFGAFINILPKRDGLLHISKINKYKLDNPNWEIEEGSIIDVIISKIDTNGKISLRLD
ncbi:MAG TPA: polyribonucleotide nucleotidyltransferase [Candidatus Azoamicus sp. OHIO1]